MIPTRRSLPLPMTPADFTALSSNVARRLGDALREGGFDDAYMSTAEAIAPRRFDTVRLPVVTAWLRVQSEPAAVLARLFAYADVVDGARARNVLTAELCAALLEAGALVETSTGITSRIRVVPFCGIHVASDPMETAGDPVMGPGAFTQEMADLMPISSGDRVLDVGSGAGSLALVAAARGAGTVVGVDLHPRAAAVASFNAVLNGLTARFETGDLTAPVVGEHFDLLVAQPPFVVKPDDVEATTYLHGGPEGDELALRLCAEVPAVLDDGGRALVLIETLRSPDAIGARVGEAIGEGPIDAISIVTPGTSADMLALGYAAIAHPDLGEAYAQTAVRYWRHLHARGGAGTRHVLVDVRRDATRSKARAVTIERQSLAGWTPAVLRQVEAAVALAVADAQTLAGARLRVPAGAVLSQSQSLDDGRTRLRLSWPGGGHDEQALTDAAAVVTEAARAPTTVDAIVAAYAEAADAAPDQVRAQVESFVRQSLATGLLVPCT
mgnify:CR=1 FL=1